MASELRVVAEGASLFEWVAQSDVVDADDAGDKECTVEEDVVAASDGSSERLLARLSPRPRLRFPLIEREKDARIAVVAVDMIFTVAHRGHAECLGPTFKRARARRKGLGNINSLLEILDQP